MGRLKRVAFILSVFHLNLWSLNAQKQESSDVCLLNMESLKGQFQTSNLKIEKSLDEQAAEILEQIKKNDVKTNLGVYETFIENTVENKLLNLQAKTSSGTIEAVYLISMILNEKFGKLENSVKNANNQHTNNENLAEKVEKIGAAVEKLQKQLDNFEQKLNSHEAAQDFNFRNLSAELANAIKIMLPEPDRSPDCSLARHIELIELRTGKYHMNKNEMSWHEAKEYCEKYGMQLVSINSPDEARTLSSSRDEPIHYWTSASDIGRTPGQFYWADGQPTEGWIWDDGEPDDHEEGRETCAYLGSSYYIRDLPCSRNYALICEKHPHCVNK